MKRSAELEMMDLPDQPRDLLIDDLRNLRTFNRYLGCHRNVLRALAGALDVQSEREFTLLDVGTGSADIPVAIVNWARRRKLIARISCLEREPITAEHAGEQTRAFPEIKVVRGDALSPPFRPAAFE